jgi:hypothetical protein
VNVLQWVSLRAPADASNSAPSWMTARRSNSIGQKAANFSANSRVASSAPMARAMTASASVSSTTFFRRRTTPISCSWDSFVVFEVSVPSLTSELPASGFHRRNW